MFLSLFGINQSASERYVLPWRSISLYCFIFPLYFQNIKKVILFVVNLKRSTNGGMWSCLMFWQKLYSKYIWLYLFSYIYWMLNFVLKIHLSHLHAQERCNHPIDFCSKKKKNSSNWFLFFLSTIFIFRYIEKTH